MELLGYAPASELDSTLVYLSVENLSARPLAVGASYLQSRGLDSRNALYSLGTGLTALCDGRQVRVGSFAAPLYGENAADASAFTLNLSAGRGAMLHCFCETPADWQTLELIYQPDFAAGQTVHFVVRRDADEVHLGAVPATLAEVGSVSICKKHSVKRDGSASDCRTVSFVYNRFSPVEFCTVSSCPVRLDTSAR